MDTGNLHESDVASVELDFASVQENETLASGLPVSDLSGVLDTFRKKAHKKRDTGKIATGTIYHFYEGRKLDKDGHWQKNGHFYWQLVYRDPDTGRRIRKGGKAFATCPDEGRKEQFLRNTGRVIESDTGRLQKVRRDTGKDATGSKRRDYALQRGRGYIPSRPS